VKKERDHAKEERKKERKKERKNEMRIIHGNVP